jgi:hypothetical protein
MSEYDSLKFLPRNVETCFLQQKALSVALSVFCWPPGSENLAETKTMVEVLPRKLLKNSVES